MIATHAVVFSLRCTNSLVSAVLCSVKLPERFLASSLDSILLSGRERYSWHRHYIDKPLMSLHNCLNWGPASPDNAVEPTKQIFSSHPQKEHMAVCTYHMLTRSKWSIKPYCWGREEKQGKRTTSVFQQLSLKLQEGQRNFILQHIKRYGKAQDDSTSAFVASCLWRLSEQQNGGTDAFSSK